MNQDYWHGLALADAQAAERFGTHVAYAERNEGYALIDAGQPQQAYNTYSWVDRREAPYGLLMIQFSPNGYYPIAQQFKPLTCQALLG